MRFWNNLHQVCDIAEILLKVALKHQKINQSSGALKVERLESQIILSVFGRMLIIGPKQDHQNRLRIYLCLWEENLSFINNYIIR